MFICQYCGKECKSKMSLIKHELYCLNNPNHKSRDIFKQNAINTNKIQTKRKIKNSQKQEYKFICKNCGKEYSLFLTENEFNKGKYTKYCSKSCSNRRILTKEIKEKISNSLKGKNNFRKKQYKVKEVKKSRICKVCGKQYKYIRAYSTKICCSPECSEYLRTHKKDFLSQETLDKFSEAGNKGCNNSFNLKRSKAEIYFYELCKKHFNNVLSNERMFNGWDADIILPDYKIAILYNGKWHYEEISKQVSLIQIQNRDKIKENEIRKCGYIPYIIKDLNKFNKTFVEEQFNLFLEYIRNISRGV